jgi:hypothetical protein
VLWVSIRLDAVYVYEVPWSEFPIGPSYPHYSGVTLNVARPDMNNYATLGVMLYQGISGSKDFALWDLARRATLGFVLY